MMFDKEDIVIKSKHDKDLLNKYLKASIPTSEIFDIELSNTNMLILVTDANSKIFDHANEFKFGDRYRHTSTSKMCNGHVIYTTEIFNDKVKFQFNTLFCRSKLIYDITKDEKKLRKHAILFNTIFGNEILYNIKSIPASITTPEIYDMFNQHNFQIPTIHTKDVAKLFTINLQTTYLNLLLFDCFIVNQRKFMPRFFYKSGFLPYCHGCQKYYKAIEKEKLVHIAEAKQKDMQILGYGRYQYHDMLKYLNQIIVFTGALQE